MGEHYSDHEYSKSEQVSPLNREIELVAVNQVA